MSFLREQFLYGYFRRSAGVAFKGAIFKTSMNGCFLKWLSLKFIHQMLSNFYERLLFN